MNFISENGIKFSSRNNDTFNLFITDFKDGSTVISLLDDVFIEFKNGKYIESYELPF